MLLLSLDQLSFRLMREAASALTHITHLTPYTPLDLTHRTLPELLWSTKDPDSWSSPPHILEFVRQVLPPTIDLFSTPYNTVVGPRAYDAFTFANLLSNNSPRPEVVYSNPPFSEEEPFLLSLSIVHKLLAMWLVVPNFRLDFVKLHILLLGLHVHGAHPFAIHFVPPPGREVVPGKHITVTLLLLSSKPITSILNSALPLLPQPSSPLDPSWVRVTPKLRL